MKQHRPAIALCGLSAGLLATLLARQRNITRRLKTENDSMRTELTARDEELVYTAKVSIPGALEALHDRALNAPEPFRPEIAETERGRKLKSLTDMIVASDERYLQRVDQAVKGTLRSVMRRVQSLVAEQQVTISSMEEQHDDPAVLDDLLRMDHMNSQLGRRAQAIAVLCGGWPGQQRSASSLTDVVRGANSRIRDYLRVNIPIDTEVAVVPRAVEPIVLAIAELLDNATRHSQPGTAVDVAFRRGTDSMVITIDDAGVGISTETLAKATELLSGQESMDIHELGEPPQVGFAVVGLLAARYGFTVSLETPNSKGGVRALVTLPNALLTVVGKPSPKHADTSTPANEILARKPVDADSIAATPDKLTASGLPVRRRREATPVSSTTVATPVAAVPTAETEKTEQGRNSAQAAALGAWQRGTRRHDDEGSAKS